MKKPPHLVIVAGEDSGDFHGANLATALQRQSPGIKLSGIGGSKMEESGVELIFPSSRLAVIGLTEVLGRISDIRAGRKAIREHLLKIRPDLLILIDFPGFNLHLVAPFAHKLKIPIVYYISPKVWAWRQGRVATINRLIDRVLVILPFEKEFFEQHNVAVEYVGNPLLDDFASFKSLDRRQNHNIALIPGSRRGEIKRLLPEMITAARLYLREQPESRFLIPVAPSIAFTDIEKLIPANFREYVTLLRQPLATLLEDVSFALVTSGTATLETALAEIPMVVIYKINQLSYLIGKRIIKVPFISLVNLIAGKEIVPELIQTEANPEKIVRQMRAIRDHKPSYNRTVQDLQKLKLRLGKPGAAQRAAAAIIDELKKHG
ncbi:MAG: lipid-A-disaccharide synthase [Deltaproteobacteria bacterium]|nr:MAG: lipid-A-disaccharide synthase [Deltaproteobacteria bacterium]